MKKIFLIINLRTLLISISSVLATWLCIELEIKADFPLTLIATAIVFPIVFSINGAYQRREVALEEYSAIKSNCQSLYYAARDWVDSPDSDSIATAKTLMGNLLFSCRELFSSSIKEFRDKEENVYRCFSDISRYIKNDLREKGMAPPEISRCNQFLNQIFLSFESAKHIYQYRTPRTLRMFSSIFITILPVLYGPYFAYQAMDYSPQVAYVMPILFTLVLVSLSNIQDHLENPFDGLGEDDISLNVEEFLERLYD